MADITEFEKQLREMYSRNTYSPTPEYPKDKFIFTGSDTSTW